MIYYIDGHNLIPKVTGLNLEQLDDENALLDRLQEYSRISRRRIEVFFDKAPDGRNAVRSIGNLKVHYVTHRTTADEAIINQVNANRKNASEITVVTSDRHVQTQCRYCRAKVLTSEQFAQDMQNAFLSGPLSSAAESAVSPAELDEWLRLFGES